MFQIVFFHSASMKPNKPNKDRWRKRVCHRLAVPDPLLGYPDQTCCNALHLHKHLFMANDGYGIQILTGPFSKWLGEFSRSFPSSLKHAADCAIIPGPSGLN
jgi:hypothetical protein